MGERRYKLLDRGLPGKCNFDVDDLSDDEIVTWDATAGKWTNSAQSSSGFTTPTSVGDFVCVSGEIASGGGFSAGQAIIYPSGTTWSSAQVAGNPGRFRITHSMGITGGLFGGTPSFKFGIQMTCQTAGYFATTTGDSPGDITNSFDVITQFHDGTQTWIAFFITFNVWNWS